jgi:hypothetical protein
MKIRQGFVTNSSSSSYIIAVKGGLNNIKNLVDVENKVWKDFIINSILALLNSGDPDGCDETRPATVYIGSKKDLDEYKSDNFESADEAEKNPLFAKFKKHLKDGYIIYNKRVGYNDSSTGEQLRKTFEGNPNFVILEVY